MTTSSKGTHSKRVEWLVLSSHVRRNRCAGSIPRPAIAAENRFQVWSRARPCFRSSLFLSRLRSSSTRFGRLRATGRTLRKIMTPSMRIPTSESSIRAIVIPFSEDTRRFTYVRKRSRDLHRDRRDYNTQSFFSIQVYCYLNAKRRKYF